MKLNGIKLTETVLKSIVWNTVISVFKDIKGIDITDKILSVKISYTKFKIKTSSPLISSELQLIDPEIKKSLQNKFEKIGFNEEFEVKYL